MLFSTSRRTGTLRRNGGGPRRTANLALRRARQARERLAEAATAEGQVQHLTSWLQASAKGRPERLAEAKQVLVDLLLGWTWDDVAPRPDSDKLANELTVEAYL